MCVCVYIHTYVYVYTYICHMYIFIYIYIHTYTSKYIRSNPNKLVIINQISISLLHILGTMF